MTYKTLIKNIEDKVVIPEVKPTSSEDFEILRYVLKESIYKYCCVGCRDVLDKNIIKPSGDYDGDTIYRKTPYQTRQAVFSSIMGDFSEHIPSLICKECHVRIRFRSDPERAETVIERMRAIASGHGGDFLNTETSNKPVLSGSKAETPEPEHYLTQG